MDLLRRPDLVRSRQPPKTLAFMVGLTKLRTFRATLDLYTYYVYIQNVPTIYWFRNIAIRIHTRDHSPAHVHAEGPDGWAKIDLADCKVTEAEGFTRQELSLIVEFVTVRKMRLLEKWKEIHDEA